MAVRLHRRGSRLLCFFSSVRLVRHSLRRRPGARFPPEPRQPASPESDSVSPNPMPLLRAVSELMALSVSPWKEEQLPPGPRPPRSGPRVSQPQEPRRTGVEGDQPREAALGPGGRALGGGLRGRGPRSRSRLRPLHVQTITAPWPRRAHLEPMGGDHPGRSPHSRPVPPVPAQHAAGQRKPGVWPGGVPRAGLWEGSRHHLSGTGWAQQAWGLGVQHPGRPRPRTRGRCPTRVSSVRLWRELRAARPGLRLCRQSRLPQRRPSQVPLP